MSGNVRTLLVVLLVLTVQPGAADSADLVPPPWRGEAGTLRHRWSFDDGDNPASPEINENPYGEAVADIDVALFGSGWLDTLPGLGETQQGYWDLGGDPITPEETGRISLTIEPCSWALTQVEVWIQVTYFQDITTAPAVEVEGGVSQGGQSALLVEAVSTGGSWRLDQSAWQISPTAGPVTFAVIADPEWGAIVDEVVVDVRCTPSTPICHEPFADADDDGDVDHEDFARWQQCLTGEGGGILPGCACFDRENGGQGDGDVDQDDGLLFEACASGPGVPADSNCDD